MMFLLTVNVSMAFKIVDLIGGSYIDILDQSVSAYDAEVTKSPKKFRFFSISEYIVSFQSFNFVRYF